MREDMMTPISPCESKTKGLDKRHNFGEAHVLGLDPRLLQQLPLVHAPGPARATPEVCRRGDSPLRAPMRQLQFGPIVGGLARTISAPALLSGTQVATNPIDFSPADQQGE